MRRFEVLLGICLIAGAEVGHLSGLLLLALLSALLAAVFMVLNKRIVEKGSDPMVMVGWEMLAANLLHPALERRFGVRPSPGGLV